MSFNGFFIVIFCFILGFFFGGGGGTTLLSIGYSVSFNQTTSSCTIDTQMDDKYKNDHYVNDKVMYVLFHQYS